MSNSLVPTGPDQDQLRPRLIIRRQRRQPTRRRPRREGRPARRERVKAAMVRGRSEPKNNRESSISIRSPWRYWFGPKMSLSSINYYKYTQGGMEHETQISCSKQRKIMCTPFENRRFVIVFYIYTIFWNFEILKFWKSENHNFQKMTKTKAKRD